MQCRGRRIHFRAACGIRDVTMTAPCALEASLISYEALYN